MMICLSGIVFAPFVTAFLVDFTTPGSVVDEMFFFCGIVPVAVFFFDPPKEMDFSGCSLESEASGDAGAISFAVVSLSSLSGGSTAASVAATED
ncbi:MAG: hypothetical protein WCD79_06425 [Chthoniobacteraceae bacterium]